MGSPRLGMLLEIAKNFNQPAEAVIFIGDTASDMQAAKVAKMNFVLLKTGKGESTFKDLNEVEQKSISVFPSLEFFVEALLSN